jgi:predicted DNA-binding protein
MAARNPKIKYLDKTFTMRLSGSEQDALHRISSETGKPISVLLRKALQFVIFENTHLPQPQKVL